MEAETFLNQAVEMAMTFFSDEGSTSEDIRQPMRYLQAKYARMMGKFTEAERSWRILSKQGSLIKPLLF